MDSPTIRYYDEHARDVADRYSSVESPVAKYLAVAFPRGARVLDIGAGSGRDIACLAAEGYAAYGVEPSPGMLAAAQS